MEGKVQPEDSELNEPDEEAELSKDEGPHAAVARPTALEPDPCDKYIARRTNEEYHSIPMGSSPCYFRYGYKKGLFICSFVRKTCVVSTSNV